MPVQRLREQRRGHGPASSVSGRVGLRNATHSPCGTSLRLQQLRRTRRSHSGRHRLRHRKRRPGAGSLHSIPSFSTFEAHLPPPPPLSEQRERWFCQFSHHGFWRCIFQWVLCSTVCPLVSRTVYHVFRHVPRTVSCTSCTRVQATLGVGSVHFWSFTIAWTKRGGVPPQLSSGCHTAAHPTPPTVRGLRALTPSLRLSGGLLWCSGVGRRSGCCWAGEPSRSLPRLLSTHWLCANGSYCAHRFVAEGQRRATGRRCAVADRQYSDCR